MTKGEIARAVRYGVLALALFAAFAVGAWKLGWFVTEKNVEERVRIENTKSGTQDAWRSEAIRTISDIAVLPDDAKAARAALTNQACELISKLTDQFLTDQLVEFSEGNC